MYRVVFLSLFGLFFLVSCRKDQTISNEHRIQINTVPTYSNNGSDPLLLDSIYTTPEGYLIKFTDIKFYLTSVNSNSNSINTASLFDLRNSGYNLIDTVGNSTDFNLITGFIGVDSSLNHLDPSSFPNESDLNIMNAGLMHWGWNTGYIFINIEGKVDTLIDGQQILDHNFSFHIGSDEFLQTFELDNLNWVEISDSMSELNLKLNLYELLHGTNPIDLKTEFLSHSGAGQELLTNKIAQNFKNSFSQ